MVRKQCRTNRIRRVELGPLPATIAQQRPTEGNDHFFLSRQDWLHGKNFLELRAIVQTVFWKASNGIILEVLFQTLDDGYSAFYELRSGDLFVHPDITI